MSTQSLTVPTEAGITSQNVNLDNCDREQVHYPGAIQPHGVLLVLKEPELVVLQSSANVETLFGTAPEGLLGQSLSHLLSDKAIHALRSGLAKVSSNSSPHEHLLRLHLTDIKSVSAIQDFEVFAHRQGNLLILEFEWVGQCPTVDLSGLYGEVRRCVARLQATRSIEEFFHIAAQEVRQLTGFDRVHVYQFLEDKSGLVRAESNRDGLGSYQGLRFPASDVPEPARRLLSQLWFRYLPDAAYQPVPIIPALNPLTGEPLDLSHALLRSTSPLCNRFYLNMGVHSTLTLTLVKDGELWGFIACHHPDPKFVQHEMREACESLAHMVSLLMSSKQEADEMGEILAAKSGAERVIEAMAREDLYHLGLVRSEYDLLGSVDALGAAMIVGEAITLLGLTPKDDQLLALAHWLASRDDVFVTDRLPELYPPADQFKAQASGLLAVRLPEGSGYLLWFRPEQVQEVRWAGDPVKPVEMDSGSGLERLGPRRSFEVWQETVHGHSRAWKSCHIEAATKVAHAIRSLDRAERLNRSNQALVLDNEELESFAYTAAHDLKEPLRGIGRYSERLMENLGNSSPEDERMRLDAILRLTRRMDGLIDSLLNYSRLGKTQLTLQVTDLSQVVREALDSLHLRVEEGKVDIIVKPGFPVLLCDPIRIHEVFTNLIANVVKYNDNDHKQVEVGAVKGSEWVFYVKDNGIGIPPEFHDSIFGIFKRLHGREAYEGGAGAGLAIVKKVIDLHGGRVWVESVAGQGSVFSFTLPNNQVVG